MANVVGVKGLREVQARMRALPQVLRDKHLLGALRKAGEPMREEAKRLAPIRTGKLRANIILAKGRATGFEHDAEVVLTVRLRGKRGDDMNAFYWKFIEFGHAVRVPRGLKGAGSLKRVPARPFIRPAFEARKQETLDLFRIEIANRIERAAAQLNPTTTTRRAA
jgi:HK97 gp10 family phage protein